jgi:hypothetical protein
MGKTAVIVNVNNEMRLMSGEKGAGRCLYRCGFWKDSFESEKIALQHCKNSARENRILNLIIQADSDMTNWIFFLCQNELNELVYVEDTALNEYLQGHADRQVLE